MRFTKFAKSSNFLKGRSLSSFFSRSGTQDSVREEIAILKGSAVYGLDEKPSEKKDEPPSKVEQ